MLIALGANPTLCLPLASGLITLRVQYLQDCCGRSPGRSTC